MTLKENDPIRLIRMLKGAPISVLLAITHAGRPVSPHWLQTVTGYSDKPVTTALRLLREYKMIFFTGRGWVPSKDIEIPIAFGPELFRNSNETLINRNNSDSSSSSNDIEVNSVNEEEEKSRKNSEVENFHPNLIACMTSGIQEPKASYLSQLEHVNPDFIYAHVKAARAEGYGLGTAISRIENGWDPPEQPTPIQKPFTSDEFGVLDRGDDEKIYE